MTKTSPVASVEKGMYWRENLRSPISAAGTWNQRLTSCHQTQVDCWTSWLGHHFHPSVFLLELTVINLMFVPEQPELTKRLFHP